MPQGIEVEIVIMDANEELHLPKIHKLSLWPRILEKIYRNCMR